MTIGTVLAEEEVNRTNRINTLVLHGSQVNTRPSRFWYEYVSWVIWDGDILL